MLSFSISYPDLRKFPHFADTIERDDRGAKREEIGGETEGNFMDNSITPKLERHKKKQGMGDSIVLKTGSKMF